jgi:hypothetical protein
MLESAIKEIDSFLESFQGIFKLEIVDTKNFTLHYNIVDSKFEEKQFSDTVTMLEWCENNLTSKK